MDNSYSEAEYHKTLEWALRKKYYAMYHSMVEDGYSDDVNWFELRKEN